MELTKIITQKFDFLSSKVNEDDIEIRDFFMTRIKIITKTLKTRILSKPNNLSEYMRIWMNMLPYLSFSDYDKKKTKDPVKLLKETNNEHFEFLLEMVMSEEEINAWFINEYANKYIDVMIIYLQYFSGKDQEVFQENAEFLINLPEPNSMNNTLFFDYSNPYAEMQMAMFKEMMEAEGDDDLMDDDEDEGILPPKNETPEEITQLQDYLKTLIQESWDKTLRSPEIDTKTIITILKSMNTKIFPKVSKPILFSDFIIAAYNVVDNVKRKLTHDDVILSIHALSSLFILLTNHGLDYTSINYYQKLYSLLNHLENIFKMKEKEKFLRLLELSIKSPMLPSTIAASFIKKLLRVILNGHMTQASLSIWAISFVCNVIKKHPVCTKLINIEVQKSCNRLQRIEERLKFKKRDRKARVKNMTIAQKVNLSSYIKNDVFDMQQKDPMKTKALETCLWEVLPFLNHSSKIIRDYASVLCTDFQHKQSLPSEELAKLVESQLIKSQLEEIAKIKTLKPQEIERIEDMYAGYDAEGERKFNDHKKRFEEEQIELFHPNSLLTRKY